MYIYIFYFIILLIFYFFSEKVKECYKVDTNLKNSTLSAEIVSNRVSKAIIYEFFIN